MVSKQQQKYVQSLHNKKYRLEYNVFLVEGEKGILELLRSDYHIIEIFATEKGKTQLLNINYEGNIYEANEKEITQISTLKNNNFGIAVVNQKEEKLDVHQLGNCIVLDGINDPGNLGTIIRLADWYGIKQIIMSMDTVEFYNPKVISASMGSFLRVDFKYCDLEEYLQTSKKNTIGAFLKGQNVHNFKAEEDLNIIIGSESHGIRKNIEPFIDSRITIPRIGEAESLNAAIATAIILDNVYRHI